MNKKFSSIKYLIDKGQDLKAKQIIEDLLHTSTQDYELNLLYAECLYHLHDYDQAISLCRKNISNFSASRDFTKILIMCLLDSKQIELATQMINESLGEFPNDDDFQLIHAYVLRIQNEIEKSEELLTNLVKRNPKNDKAYRSRGLLRVANKQKWKGIKDLFYAFKLNRSVNNFYWLHDNFIIVNPYIKYLITIIFVILVILLPKPYFLIPILLDIPIRLILIGRFLFDKNKSWIWKGILVLFSEMISLSFIRLLFYTFF